MLTRRTLFTAVVLGLLAALVVSGQTVHTFAALDTNNPFTGSNSFTQQIISSLATGTAPFSIASTTVVPNLNAQLHNGLTAPASAIVGINDSQTLSAKTLTTPIINGATAGTGVQGTDSKLLTSGTVSGTGVGLCTDANGGATTSGCSSGATEFALSANGNSAGLSTACGEGSAAGAICNETVLAKAHTLVRLTYNLAIAPVGCSTNAVIGVRDVTSSTNLTTITVNQASAQFVDSGALNIATTAGDKIVVGPVTASSGCSTTPTASSITAVFQ